MIAEIQPQQSEIVAQPAAVESSQNNGADEPASAEEKAGESGVKSG